VPDLTREHLLPPPWLRTEAGPTVADWLAGGPELSEPHVGFALTARSQAIAFQGVDWRVNPGMGFLAPSAIGNAVRPVRRPAPSEHISPSEAHWASLAAGGPLAVTVEGSIVTGGIPTAYDVSISGPELAQESTN
jgi:hypothetical protein